MNLIKEIDVLRKSVDKVKEYIRTILEPAFVPSKIKVGIDLNLKGKEIGLVLSGGGARGIAHVGILKILEENGIKPAFIVGTSAGAIVGAFYAGGMSPDEIFNFYTIEDRAFRKLSLLKSVKPSRRSKILRGLLSNYLPVETFEETEIPLFINAVDIKSCKRMVFSKGEIIPAVLGSSAIPFVFEPVEFGKRLLLDGGVLDLFGVDIARKVNKSVFLNKLNLVISDVSGLTDESSGSKLQSIILNVSKEVIDLIKYLGQKKSNVNDKNDIIPIINNLIYLLKKRPPLFPKIIEKEYLLCPQLEGMRMFDFKDYKKAFLKGIKAILFLS